MTDRAHRRLAALPGVGKVRRPVTAGGDDEFDLHYVRTGPRSRQPLVVVPGGPGVASIGHYRRLRRNAAQAGLDVIMVEHRGVGLSRRQDTGADLPPAALTIDNVVDDIAAVLDDAGVAGAVVYGTSYGSYLAAGVGVRHPGRVHAMVLDSPLLGAEDIGHVRDALRGLLWEGRVDADLAATARHLELSPHDAQFAAAVYELGGPALLKRHLDGLLAGRRALWSTAVRIGRALAHRPVPYRNESDLVGMIGFRELNFGDVPDGLPLDPAVVMREAPGGQTPFDGEPFDLAACLHGFDWPTVVLSGGHDLTTPPSVAEHIAALLPRGTLVTLPTAGHSILDTREQAALRVAAAVCAGETAALATAGANLDALPANPGVRVLRTALWAGASVLPGRRGRSRVPGPTS